MSGEQISNFKHQHQNNIDSNKSKKVNINVLLKKIRAVEKKEQMESNVFFGLIIVVVITAGIIVSL